MQVVFKQLTILYVFLLAGWLIGKFKKEKAPHADILSVLLVNFLLPCKIFSTFANNVTLTYLAEHWSLLATSVTMLSILAGNHKFDPQTGWFSARTEKDGDDSVVIGEGTWIASGVTVTPGVKIGRANLICAGAVLTKSTEDYAIMAGVPAKKVGYINKDTGEYVWFSRAVREESES